MQCKQETEELTEFLGLEYELDDWREVIKKKMYAYVCFIHVLFTLKSKNMDSV
jgi:hypothetical protein